MIKGVHAMFYSNRADEMRAYIRDKLRLPFTDVGDGWLIFDLPEGDVGVHPTEGGDSGTHNVSFYCDDINKTVADLESRGVKFDQKVEDHGYGLVTLFTMPGGVKVQLYEPRYQKRKAKKASAHRSRPKPANLKSAQASKGSRTKSMAKRGARTTRGKAPRR